ncbi:MAG: hypothetical protein KGL39_40575 [Patescibacteria group bacterium]|nr:hypothetical protein [Patescibacteria group bacterium]
MGFPYTFANESGNQPASQLDANFAYALATVAKSTLAELKAMTGGDVLCVSVGYKTTPGDGWGGVFYWNNVSVAAGDDILIVAPDAGGTGRWYRIWDQQNLQAAWAGVVSGTSASQTTAYQAGYDKAAALGSNYVLPPGTIRLDTQVTHTANVLVLGAGAGSVMQPAQTPLTKIAWYGGASVMIADGGNGSLVAGGGVVGVTIDGRALATECIRIKDRRYATFRMTLTGATTNAIELTNTAALADPTGFMTLELTIQLRTGTTNAAHGIYINGVGTGTAGVTTCTMVSTHIEHANGHGVRIAKRGDGFHWIGGLYTYRSNAETGFGVFCETTGADVSIGGHTFDEATLTGAAFFSQAGDNIGWTLKFLDDLNVASGIDAGNILQGPGCFDVTVLASYSERKNGQARESQTYSYRQVDPCYFVRWDSANNVLATMAGNYITGGTYTGSATIADAAQQNGAINFQTGNSTNNAIWVTPVATIGSGGTSATQQPWMMVQVAPISSTAYKLRLGFVGSPTFDPDNAVYLEASPADNANFVFKCRSSAVETSVDTGLAIAASTPYQFRMRFNTGYAVLEYRGTATSAWSQLAKITAHIPSAAVSPIVHISTQANANKNAYLSHFSFGADMDLFG